MCSDIGNTTGPSGILSLLSDVLVNYQLETLSSLNFTVITYITACKPNSAVSLVSKTDVAVFCLSVKLPWPPIWTIIMLHPRVFLLKRPKADDPRVHPPQNIRLKISDKCHGVTSHVTNAIVNRLLMWCTQLVSALCTEFGRTRKVEDLYWGMFHEKQTFLGRDQANQPSRWVTSPAPHSFSEECEDAE